MGVHVHVGETYMYICSWILTYIFRNNILPSYKDQEWKLPHDKSVDINSCNYETICVQEVDFTHSPTRLAKSSATDNFLPRTLYIT